MTRPVSAGSAKRLGGLLLLLALGACSQNALQTGPQEPTADTACALDGMILMDHPGPKAQIRYTEGEPDFFCDMNELFAVLRSPENKKAMAGIFVQDMGKTDWNHPKGHWVDAKKAVYVTGSGKSGSMGPTIASFAERADAEAFAAKEGGKVQRFDEVNAAEVDMQRGMPGSMPH